MPRSRPRWNTYTSEPTLAVAIPDDGYAVGMLAPFHVVPSNVWRLSAPPLARANTARWPGVVSTTAPVAGNTYAVARGGVQGRAGACSAVELSTASVVVHAYSATVYGGV